MHAGAVGTRTGGVFYVDLVVPHACCKLLFTGVALFAVKDVGNTGRVGGEQHGISGPNGAVKAGPGLLDPDFWRLLTYLVKRNVRNHT